MEQELRREIILDNYQNPKNKVDAIKDGYIKANTNNESCIDNITVMAKIDNDVIADICFLGEACAISTSATSIMIKNFIGKTVDEAWNIIKEYENMLNEQPYNQEILRELIVYNEIYKQPNRKGCALLPFNSIKRILEDYQNSK